MIKPDPSRRQRLISEEEEMERNRKALEAYRERRIDELHERSDRAPEPGKAFKTVFYLSAVLFLLMLVLACIGLGVACVFYIFKP